MQAMDPSPHATFRPREKETKHFRRTRKNDREAFNKLEVIVFAVVVVVVVVVIVIVTMICC